MKKFLLSAAALVALSFGAANAQVSVTFKVDITEFLAGGGTINNVVSIAGNITTSGGDITDWTPADGAMTDMGSNMWSRTLSFDGTATDSLNWKYVQGSAWADGDEGNEWTTPEPSCSRPSDNNNRKLLLPTSGVIEYISEWAKCPSAVAIKVKVQGIKVAMGPNPTNNSLNVSFWGSANAKINIVSMDGRTVNSYNVAEAGQSTNVIDVSSFANGLYYVTVLDGDKFFKSSFVVNK